MSHMYEPGKITIEVQYTSQGASILRSVAANIEAFVAGSLKTTESLPTPKPVAPLGAPTKAPAEEKKKPGRPVKAPEPEPEYEEGDENDEDSDESDEEDFLGETKPKKQDTTPVVIKTLHLETDVIPAFKRFAEAAGTGGRAEAAAFLKKYSDKSVREIPKEKFREVITALDKMTKAITSKK